MADFISNSLVTIVDLVWGTPLVVLLIGGGCYLAFVSRFQSLRGMIHAFKLITGRFHHQGDETAPGQISHFKALTNALSATVGMGNISGVAVAIHSGGPGAVFWMWVTALVGMNTKFFECTLAVMFRSKDHEGEIQGGPMYVIAQALPKLKPLAYAFAVFGVVGTLALFNANQFAEFMSANYPIGSGEINGVPITKWIVGAVTAAVVGFILMGGVRRIATFTSGVVPIMCVLYVLGALGVIFLNIELVPTVLINIVQEALSGRAAKGAIEGMGVIAIMRIGVKRAAFSNEAGVGTAPMAHGNAHTKEPIAEGLVAMVGPAIDTLIVCTMTALVILISLPNYMDPSVGDGVLMTTTAFEYTYGKMGTHILGIAIFMFSFSTIVGMANYNKKCFDFIFKGKGIFKETWFYVLFYCTTVVLGSVWSSDDVINLLDIGYGLMAWPNMIATLILAPKVKKAMDEYFARYHLKHIDKK